MTRHDLVIVGAGIAGASLAAELAPHMRITILEAEERPGVHATGRSAAFWMESYGGPGVLPLTRASGPWLAEGGFLRERGGLHIARREQIAALDRLERRFAPLGVPLRRLARAEMEGMVPGLLPAWCEAVHEPGVCDIDVAGLHQHYLGLARAGGAELLCRSRLAVARRQDGIWSLGLADGRQLQCQLLVNAAGAWADEVARLAGVCPLGITPLRRTMVQLRMAQPVPPVLPLVLDIGGSFYFKPEAGRLWLTPHDEHPSPPCDTAPEEVDVALAIDRLAHAVDWPVARVEHKWAGLRSFAPDRLPVYGPDRREPGFFWFVGQGGFGIQTAPAAARLFAQTVLGTGPDAMIVALDPGRYRPARFG